MNFVRHCNIKNFTTYYIICALLTSTLMGSTAQLFLTAADFLRASKEENITFLTERDFQNANQFRMMLSKKNLGTRKILTKQKYYRGDIRGKAAWRRERKNFRKTPFLDASFLLNNNNVRYNGVMSQVKKWTGARIPYVLSTEYTERERAILAKAFQEYHTRTCIRFIPRTNTDRDYLYIGKIDGCFSDVGRAGGRQELSLDNGCLHLDTIIHELMHSVGFYHEHERWDRDRFITILWPNIDREAYDQFGRVDLTESSYYGQPYDYFSRMQKISADNRLECIFLCSFDSANDEKPKGGAQFFFVGIICFCVILFLEGLSKNGLETLNAKVPEMTKVIGSAMDFSPIDLIKIHKMYQCQMHSDNIFPTMSSPARPAQILTNKINPVAFADVSLPQKPPPYNIFAQPQRAQQPIPARPVFAVSSARGTSLNGGFGRSSLKKPFNTGFAPLRNDKESNVPQLNGAIIQKEPKCIDKAVLCTQWNDRCNSALFEKTMRDFCALSCGFCSSTNEAADITLSDDEDVDESFDLNDQTRIPYTPLFSSPSFQPTRNFHSFPVLVNAPTMI